MKKNFAVDSKNIGGMKMLNDNMFLHHKALVNAKPAISIKPPRPVSNIQLYSMLIKLKNNLK